MVSTLITVAVIAWCAQLALGGWQISLSLIHISALRYSPDRLKLPQCKENICMNYSLM